MTSFLEIAQLENGDVVLREVREDEAAELLSAPEQSSGPAAEILPEAERLESERVQVGKPRDGEPLVRIRFSREVQDLLGGELVDVAEAMIDAATDFLDGEALGGAPDDPAEEPPPVVH